MASPPFDRDRRGPLTPEEAFALLGNETRVGILRALWDAFEPRMGSDAVPFSSLYDAVDVGDSGNFAYHLEKLTGRFVRKTDGGYELTQAGLDVLRAVIAGTVTEAPALGPHAADVRCPLCDGPVEVTYGDDSVRARCTACEGLSRRDGEPGYFLVFPLPPVGLERRTADDVLAAAVTYNFHQAATMLDGVCPVCSGPSDLTVGVCADHEPGERGCPSCELPYPASALTSCPTCKRWIVLPVRGAALSLPIVAAFYHDHGVEHRFASWAAFRRSHDVDEEVVSEDPLRVRVGVPAGDETLRLTLDDELSVLDASP